MAKRAFVRTDLHGHSCLSDGLSTPADYVKARADEELEVIALSDHDIVSGVRAAAAVAKRRGLTLVPAMETSAFIHFGTEAAEQVHVLAYFPPSLLEGKKLEKTALATRGQRIIESWRAFVVAWIDALPMRDVALVDGDKSLRTLDAADFPGLAVFLAHLVGEGRRDGETVEAMRQRLGAREHVVTAFHRHHVRFWTEQPELFGWSPEEMIETIRADGAFDVVAHPNRIRDTRRMEQVLTYAQGVEVYTSRHSDTVSAKFLEYATRHGKHWTASTDDHQHIRQRPYRPPPSGTPRATVERILSGAP
ncbi:MAG: PHP domain-containing protein [Myxococcales bacterium]|nr:PHP domain-containing protein [Myxococcales bacterium]